MIDELKAHLSSIGLSDKESAVYLALLTLRTANPQRLAEQASVNRSTTYLALEALQKHGLVSSVEKDNKIHYIAEHPERLVQLVDAATREVEARKKCIETALPHLLALFQVSGDAPRVRFFEGAEALQAAREEMWATRASVCEVFAVDEETARVATIKEAERIKLTERIRGGRLLVAIKPGQILPRSHPDAFEVRALDYKQCPFRGSLTMAGNKLCVVTTNASGMGILVDSTELTTVFQALFEAAWASARPQK